MGWRDDESDDESSEDLGERDETLDEDTELQSETEVTCPYCGEVNSITLDAAGGATQEYVEDCQVCCRPWQVHVAYDENGTAEVWVNETA